VTPHRILYVITDLQIGGVPLHLFRLARHLRGCGFNVQVTCLSPPGPVSSMLAAEGIPTSACHAFGAADWRVFERLSGIVADFAPDVVHSFLFHANMACRIVSLLGSLPSRRLVCEIQTVEVERPWHLTVERLTHRWCRCVVGNSPSVIEHLARHARIGAEQLVLVPGGVDPEPIRSADPADRRALGLNPVDPVLLWVGRLDPVKGLDDLIAAAAIVHHTIPVQLVLVGEGKDRDRLNRLATQRGIADRVHLTGRRSDTASLLRMADLFVFPSLTEGMPNALLEAMAAGLPIVATDVPGNRDLIEGGETGLLVPARQPRPLADAIAMLLKNKRMAQQLGRGASRAVDERFHVTSTYRRYLDLYRAIIAESP
jgi:glycosyltransferase involved in cell wall biosynthesis